MTPDQVRTIGETLYGPRYKDAMVRDLRVSRRTLDRWLAGSFTIPDNIGAKLAFICSWQIDGIDTIAKARKQELRGLLKRIEAVRLEAARLVEACKAGQDYVSREDIMADAEWESWVAEMEALEQEEKARNRAG